ncbi:hypothetical protein ACF0H5_018433 [Mactra antiquata]
MADGNEEGRAKALKYYKLMAVAQALLGIGMLVCGVVAAINQDEDVFGPPYFVGGFVVGIMALIAALLCSCIIAKAPGASSSVNKQELGCAMTGHYILSMFMIMGCFMGVVLAGIGGFGFSDHNDRSSLNKSLAVVILVGCIVGLFLTIGSLCIVCTYGRYFGIVITSGHRGRTVIINTNTTGNQIVGMQPVTTHGAVFQTDYGMGMGTNQSQQISELEQQNRLLQQQLELQRQLNQAQQQQQPYGGGFQQPPPPPMYPGNAAYPPTAPPPSYSDVK